MTLTSNQIVHYEFIYIVLLERKRFQARLPLLLGDAITFFDVAHVFLADHFILEAFNKESDEFC